MQFRCATAGASQGQGQKMAGLSRTGSYGNRGYDRVTYGFFCHKRADRVYLVNYGTQSSYNTGRVPASSFLIGAGWSASDVFSIEIAGSTMQVCPRSPAAVHALQGTRLCTQRCPRSTRQTFARRVRSGRSTTTSSSPSPYRAATTR